MAVKSFQTKLPVFKRELAEDSRASFSAIYVKIVRGGNSPLEALIAKILIKDILIMVLIDRGRSVNILSDTLYQQLGEMSQIRVCNKKIIAASNGKVPVKKSTAIQVQLQKLTSEITLEFLVTENEITPCFLGNEVLYNFDCIFNTRKKPTFLRVNWEKHYNSPHRSPVG